MSQHNTEPKSWLIRVHQKINASMAKRKPKPTWIRARFGIALNATLFAVFACNWYVIYGTSVEAMPAWLTWLAQWVLDNIPGAQAHVQHSWYLRDVFPYIYTVNLIGGLLFSLVFLLGSTVKADAPLLQVTSYRDILKFHSTYLISVLFSGLVLFVFYCGYGLEPAFEAKPMPKTSASGGAVQYRMFETHFGALVMYGGVFGLLPGLFFATVQFMMRWYQSAFVVFYIVIFKKELSK